MYALKAYRFVGLYVHMSVYVYVPCTLYRKHCTILEVSKKRSPQKALAICTFYGCAAAEGISDLPFL